MSRLFGPVGLGALLLAGAAPALAQAPAATGAMADPCAVMTPLPAIVADYLAAANKAAAEGKPAPGPSPERTAAYNSWAQKHQLEDFADHCRFATANALPPATKRRVIFFGDSITENWLRYDPALFTGEILNRGISGQTTDQMVGRFMQDVVDLHPAAVHILAATNDIAGNTGPTSLARIQTNIRTMADLAKAHHIQVILAAVTPAARYSWRPEIQSIAPIEALNAWMKAYAKAQDLIFVEYQSVLDDGAHGLKLALSADGVHPNAEGYRLMRPITERAIGVALKR